MPASLPRHHQSIWLISFCWFCLLGLTGLLSTRWLTSIDTAILQSIHTIQTPFLDQLMIAITQLSHPYATISLTAGSVAALYYFQRQAQASRFILTISGAVALNLLFKQLVHRPRPELWPHLVVENGFSFPSGHATISMTFVLTFIILAWPTRYRWPVTIVGLGLAVAVAVSRLYLGVHFPSDIMAAWLFCIGWVSLIWLLPSSSQSQKVTPAV